jgi:hypothetical protein
MVDNNILLLGMVFSDQLIPPSRGQNFRDQVRCVELQNLGFKVLTVDDKHEDDYFFPGKYCNANFNNDRGMLKQIQEKWGNDIKFSHIILDYFFSPVGWARDRWQPTFYSKTIPSMALKLFSPGGILWLPHLQNVTESIQLNQDSIDAYFIVHEVDDPMSNPLYAATEQATDELKRCPDFFLNENHLPPLLVESRFPFYALRLKRALLEEDHQCDEEDDDEAIDTLRMWDAISATPDISSTTIFVRVFTGADGSHQKGPFLIALQAFQRSLTTICGKVIIVEELSTKQLAAHKWQPSQYVDWLLHSHVHFILGHVHQSLRLHNLIWYMPEALKEYQSLTYHPGFPSGDQLRCPVFTQDKHVYLRALGNLANRTLTVPVTEDGIYDTDCLQEVERYVVDFVLIIIFTSFIVDRFLSTNEENGCGWVIKAPFTTNCESVRYAKTYADVVKYMRSLSKLYLGNVPYLMIQPCMYNRCEVKIVVLKNQPLYKASIATGAGAKSKGGVNKTFSGNLNTLDALLAFANTALEKLLSTVPYAITDGLFRVDIFQTISGQLVVNEFESLEADFGCKASGSTDFEAFAWTFLSNYWSQKIESLIKV